MLSHEKLTQTSKSFFKTKKLEKLNKIVTTETVVEGGDTVEGSADDVSNSF